MNSLTSAQIQTAVSKRYSEQASCCSNLSCGAALDVAKPTTGEVYVDLGCGRGQDVIRAAGRVGSTGRAIGIDISIEMLKKARANVPSFVSNARFVRCDLARLELPSGHADVVTSNCTINHAPDKRAVYKEIYRVLKPGGRFVVSDVIAEATLPESVRSDPAAWADCYGGAIPEEEYLAAARDAGFDEVEVVSRSEPYAKGTVMVRSITIRAYRKPEEASPPR